MSSIALPFAGAGGEPISFALTMHSHGLAMLPPAVVAADNSYYRYRVRLSDRIRTLEFRHSARELIVSVAGTLSKSDGASVARIARNMFHLEANLAPFYEMVRDDAQLQWATVGAGRFLASPSVFEDVIRTICTTNCAWSGTGRMIGALVELGEGAFPAPDTLAKTPERWFAEKAKMGYRGPYVRAIAKRVAREEIDLEALRPGTWSDEEVEEALLDLDGVGPYAAAHIMQLLGYHRRLILDSWTRPTYCAIAGKRQAKDTTIERHFARYKQFAGLAFWLYLTRDRLAEQGNLNHSS